MRNKVKKSPMIVLTVREVVPSLLSTTYKVHTDQCDEYDLTQLRKLEQMESLRKYPWDILPIEDRSWYESFISNPDKVTPEDTELEEVIYSEADLYNSAPINIKMV